MPMPCNLVILGKDLDIDAFLGKSKLRGFTRLYKGEPRFKSKADGERLDHSRVAIQTRKHTLMNWTSKLRTPLGI